eukprot:5989696-Prymnesium_polylepis.1
MGAEERQQRSLDHDPEPQTAAEPRSARTKTQPLWEAHHLRKLRTRPCGRWSERAMRLADRLGRISGFKSPTLASWQKGKKNDACSHSRNSQDNEEHDEQKCLLDRIIRLDGSLGL